MYSLLQKLEQRLKKTEVLINLAEGKSSKYLSIEDRERLNAVNNFIEDYYLFVNYINKQYEIKNLIVIQEALKSKQEQLTFYLNTLDEIINRRIEYSKN